MIYENSLYKDDEILVCHECGTDQTANSNFCSKCGTKLRVICSTCWFKINEGTGTFNYCKGNECPKRK